MLTHRYYVCSTLVCLLILPASGMLSSLFSPAASHAQSITLDGSVGNAGLLELSGPDYVVGAEVGEQHGGNLFHSFGEFNVQTGESATFTGPATVENVIGRVTGGNASMIDGRLRSEIPDANLYLLNPSGVLFGENASLDVQGSLHVSTADYLKLGDGAPFHAQLGQGSTLSAAPPEAFGFLGENPAGISIAGSELRLPEGEAFSLIGGDLAVAGAGGRRAAGAPPTLEARGGQLTLISVASPGEVQLVWAKERHEIKVDSFERLGSILLTEAAFLDASGESGGTILIRGGRLLVENASIFSDTRGNVDGATVGIDIDIVDEMIVTDADITTEARGSGDAGDLRLIAGQLEVRGGALLSASTFGAGQGGSLVISADHVLVEGAGRVTRLVTEVLRGGSGDAGDLVISAGQLEVRGGALLSTSTFGAGRGGNLVISAEHVLVEGEVQLPVLATGAPGESSGDSGDIMINAGQLEVRDGALISASTSGAGRGGNLFIIADHILAEGQGTHLETEALPGSSGAAGDLTLTAGQLEVRDGALISTSTFGAGRGGNLAISANHILVEGGGQFAKLATEALAGSSGAAGDLTITAGQLEVRGSALISTSTFGTGRGGNLVISADHILVEGDGQIAKLATEALAGSSGAAGDLSITAGQLEVRGGALISASTQGAGRGGNLLISAEDIALNDGTIAARSGSLTAPEAGNAGELLIQADTLTLRTNSRISVETDQADAGSLELQINSQLLLRDQSNITTSVASGEGAGGNILVGAEFVILDDSAITANAVAGAGGNIGIASAVFLASPASIVSASSRLGNPGLVDVSAPVTDITGSFARLSGNFLAAAAQLRNHCAAQRAKGQTGSFVVRGRDSVPTRPTDLQPSHFSLKKYPRKQAFQQHQASQQHEQKESTLGQPLPDGVCQAFPSVRIQDGLDGLAE